MLRSNAGFTLIEILISMALFSILLALAVPSFSEWIQNQQIRTTAEGIYSALQRAQAEAAKRNQPVDFALISSIPSPGTAPVTSNTGPNWVVAVDQGGAPTAAGFIQGGLGAESGKNASITTSQNVVTFYGTGTLPPGAAAAVVTVANPTGGACATAAGPMQCLKITVAPYGKIRMCNPAQPAGSPQGC